MITTIPLDDNYLLALHIAPLVINGLGSAHTDTHMHTDGIDKKNFKTWYRLASIQHTPGLKVL